MATLDLCRYRWQEEFVRSHFYRNLTLLQFAQVPGGMRTPWLLAIDDRDIKRDLAAFPASVFPYFSISIGV